MSQKQQNIEILILNEIDQKNYEYLMTLVDHSAVEYAIAELTNQNKRPYLSNIFKILEIPLKH